MIQNSFWSGKRVLVTGHTGFKGSWLTFWLNQLGAKVHGISLAPSTNPAIFEALDLKSDCDHRLIDIRDGDLVSRAIAEIDPEIVFHMAAQPLVRLSYASPMETYATNVMGTGNVLLALQKTRSTRAIVVVTTDKCYENREWHFGYREIDPLGGYDPYSSSKACAEILTASFRRSFFEGGKNVGIASVRAGNVIGGGDWSADRLIPDVVRSYVNGNSLEIRYPGSIRPWQHVIVPLSGYLMLAEKLHEKPLEWSQPFNFAPADEDCVPVQSVLEKFGKAWGKPVSWSKTPGAQLHEAHFLKLDSSKAKGTMGWKPAMNLDQALKATADWYREYCSNPKGIRVLTKTQIMAAMELT